MCVSSAEQLHMGCCISQLAKDFFLKKLLLDSHEMPESFPSHSQKQGKYTDNGCGRSIEGKRELLGKQEH